jgi:uncharacterized protein
MKYVLIFALVFLVAWRWRSARTGEQLKKAQKKAAAQAAPMDMLACSQCGLHIPAQDAFAGTRGSYCSAAHLKIAEH